MIPQGFPEMQRVTAGETVFLFQFLQLEADCAGGRAGGLPLTSTPTPKIKPSPGCSPLTWDNSSLPPSPDPKCLVAQSHLGPELLPSPLRILQTAGTKKRRICLQQRLGLVSGCWQPDVSVSAVHRRLDSSGIRGFASLGGGGRWEKKGKITIWSHNSSLSRGNMLFLLIDGGRGTGVCKAACSCYSVHL